MENTPPCHPRPSADQVVADVLAVWPQTIRVFLDHRMSCVGCAMAGYDTVADVAANYGHSLDALVDELTAASVKEPASS